MNIWLTARCAKFSFILNQKKMKTIDKNAGYSRKSSNHKSRGILQIIFVAIGILAVLYFDPFNAFMSVIAGIVLTVILGMGLTNLGIASMRRKK